MGIMRLPKEIKKDVADVPMISEVAQKLLAIIGDKEHSSQDVVRIIEKDVYLASRILRISNSALYSRGQKINSIQRAVMHLGETVIIGIAIGASTGDMLTNPLVGYEGPEGSLWTHCLLAALAAREIAKFTDGKVGSDEAYTAALLMDVGMAVLSRHLGDKIDDVIKKVDSKTVADFLEAERDEIGVDHAVVGSEVAEKWNLPEVLTVAIRDHHRPKEAPEEYRPLVYTVHVADIVARIAGFGVGVEALSYSLDDGYQEYISLDKKKLEELILLVAEEYSKIKEFIFMK